MDISELDINGLKVLAYDILATIQENQRNLQAVNEMIVQKSRPEKESKKGNSNDKGTKRKD